MLSRYFFTISLLLLMSGALHVIDAAVSDVADTPLLRRSGNNADRRHPYRKDLHSGSGSKTNQSRTSSSRSTHGSIRHDGSQEMHDATVASVIDQASRKQQESDNAHHSAKKLAEVLREAGQLGLKVKDYAHLTKAQQLKYELSAQAIKLHDDATAIAGTYDYVKKDGYPNVKNKKADGVTWRAAMQHGKKPEVLPEAQRCIWDCHDLLETMRSGRH